MVIAKYDADTHRKHATMHGVSGYPTIKMFSGGALAKATEVYEGPRRVRLSHAACQYSHSFVLHEHEHASGAQELIRHAHVVAGMLLRWSNSSTVRPARGEQLTAVCCLKRA